MKTLNRLTAVLFTVLALFMTGCSGGDTHEKIVDDMVAQMEKIADAYGTVKDKATAEKAAADIKAASAEIQKIAERAKKIGEPKGDAKTQIEAKMKTKMEAVTKKMMTNAMKAATAGPEAAPIIQQASLEMQKSMQAIGSSMGGK